VSSKQSASDQPDANAARCASSLATALGAAVLLPGTPEYARALARLFSAEASVTRPACIVQARSAAEVAATVKIARESGCPLTVRGGGHGALCAADQAVMIDLAAHLGAVALQGDVAVAGGGATMGGVLEALAPHGRLLPVGVARTPGMGLALQGGVGYLTRSLGLTLDHLRAVEIVVASGEVLHLSEQSSGDEADLWWAVRGCAPNFGIVTSASFRARSSPTRVLAQRLLLPLDVLPAFLEAAQALPRDTTASAVLGRPADAPAEPLLFAYVVHAGDDSEGALRVRDMTRALGRAPLLEHADLFPYAGMPPMDMPALSGFQTAELPVPPASQRVFAFKKCPFIKMMDATAAEGLMTAVRSAPTALCRIDLQHCGGAVGDVLRDATAFWNRDFEWNCPIIGAWSASEDRSAACIDWATQTARTLAPYTAGVYAVELLPGRAETAAEVELAFGGNLAWLRELKQKWDPDRMFRHYYPL
jgi:hypothetical protein